jgi:hypothetical protein
MKKFLFIILFSLILISPVFATETKLYAQAVEQLSKGNYGSAYELFTQDCSHDDVAGCSMMAIAEYPIDHGKSIGIAKLWLQFLKNSKSEDAHKFRAQLIDTYIQFYSHEGANVEWLKELRK